MGRRMSAVPHWASAMLGNYRREFEVKNGRNWIGDDVRLFKIIKEAPVLETSRDTDDFILDTMIEEEDEE